MESTLVTRLPFSTHNYSDLDTFHVLDLGTSEVDLILGKPWLSRINPKPDWRQCTLRFQHGRDKIHLIPIHDSETRRLATSLVMSSAELKRCINQKDELFLISLKCTEDGNVLLRRYLLGA